MKKQLLLLVMMLLPMVASAGDVVEVDGIYYNLIEKSKEAEVTKNPNGNYRISVDIPAYFEYGGETYRVYAIGYGAFQDCRELYSVIIPNTVTTIGMYAFSRSSISAMDIPNSVTTIGKWAFMSCANMKSVNIPNSVTDIDEGAFDHCSGLTTVEIPSSMTYIGNFFFSGCSSLKSVTIPNSVTYIGWHAFDYCSNLTSITIPSGVTLIGDFAFMGCSSLKSVIIPNKVKSIGFQAFQYCSNLATVTIGSSVEVIGTKAFAYCMELADVYCYAEKVPAMKADFSVTVTDAFENSHIEDIILHVPAASVNLYKAVEPWKSFKSIVGIDAETPKCELPTISYENGKLKFGCATEGAEYVYEITDTDITKGYANEVQLSVTYTITVYATKLGYDNSETATATLCWIDQEPKTEGVSTDGIANIPANAVLIQTSGSTLTVQGADDGTQVMVYTSDGTEAGSAVSRNGQAEVNTNLQPGSVVIVKIGEKAVKVVMK